MINPLVLLFLFYCTVSDFKLIMEEYFFGLVVFWLDFFRGVVWYLVLEMGT